MASVVDGFQHRAHDNQIGQIAVFQVRLEPLLRHLNGVFYQGRECHGTTLTLTSVILDRRTKKTTCFGLDQSERPATTSCTRQSGVTSHDMIWLQRTRMAATRFDRDAARLSISASVATTWFQTLALQEREDIAP